MRRSTVMLLAWSTMGGSAVLGGMIYYTWWVNNIKRLLAEFLWDNILFQIDILAAIAGIEMFIIGCLVSFFLFKKARETPDSLHERAHKMESEMARQALKTRHKHDLRARKEVSPPRYTGSGTTGI